jgi:hypothetical protein
VISDDEKVQLTNCYLELHDRTIDLANAYADRDRWMKYAKDLEVRLQEKIDALVKACDMLAKFQEEVAGQYGSTENEAQV